MSTESELRVISPADDWRGECPDPPCCPVCRDGLGQAVYLQILGQDGGGDFRVTCRKHDEAHDPNGNRWYPVEGLQGAGWVLAHVGRKTWADEYNVLAALWPWLQRVAA